MEPLQFVCEPLAQEWYASLIYFRPPRLCYDVNYFQEVIYFLTQVRWV